MIAVPIENDIKSVQVFDCSDNAINTTTKEILNLRLNATKADYRLPVINSFHPSRFDSGLIAVNGSTCYLWKLQLTKPETISFMTIDMGTKLDVLPTRNQSEANSSATTLDLFTAETFVSPYRVCRAIRNEDFISEDEEINETFLLKGFYFSCDSISDKDYLAETRKLTRTVIVQTRSAVARDIHLVAVFLAKHKLNPKNSRPECGKPETVSTGVNHRIIYKTGRSESNTYGFRKRNSLH